MININAAVLKRFVDRYVLYLSSHEASHEWLK